MSPLALRLSLAGIFLLVDDRLVGFSAPAPPMGGDSAHVQQQMPLSKSWGPPTCSACWQGLLSSTSPPPHLQLRGGIGEAFDNEMPHMQGVARGLEVYTEFGDGPLNTDASGTMVEAYPDYYNQSDNRMTGELLTYSRALTAVLKERGIAVVAVVRAAPSVPKNPSRLVIAAERTAAEQPALLLEPAAAASSRPPSVSFASRWSFPERGWLFSSAQLSAPFPEPCCEQAWGSGITQQNIV